jgi:hypothetical protein
MMQTDHLLITEQISLPGSDTKRQTFSRLADGMAVATNDSKMKNQDYHIGGYDIGLAVFVVTTAWLLIFQSGLLGK